MFNTCFIQFFQPLFFIAVPFLLYTIILMNKKFLIRQIKKISSKYKINTDDIYYSFENELINWIQENDYNGLEDYSYYLVLKYKICDNEMMIKIIQYINGCY